MIQSLARSANCAGALCSGALNFGALNFGALCLALVCLGGCTLVVSPEEGQSCTADEQCAATSELAGFPASCRKYFCNEGTCLEYQDGDEICDGFDNDCDGIIDEPSDVSESPWREVVVTAVDVPTGVPVSYAATASVETASWVQEDMARQVRLGEMSVPQPVDYVTTSTGLDLVGPGCRYDAPLDRVFGCAMAAIASEPTHPDRGLQMLATVTTSQCAKGRLLIGHSPDPTAGDAVSVVLRAPVDGVSNSLAGIDVGDGQCTGASRPGCLDGEGSCGAGRPRISTIPSAIPSTSVEQRVAEGLVAWVGDTVERDQCGGAVAPVEAVVAHLQRLVDPTEHFWVTASGDSIPETLGETRGGGIPAIARWMTRGWIAAFGNAEGDVELVWIPSQPRPPTSTSGDPVPPLSGVTSLGQIDADGADHVSLSIGSMGEGELELGLTWLEGCGTDAQRIVFARASSTVSGMELTSARPLGDSVILEAASSLGPPALGYLRLGFLVPGTQRGDQTVTESTSGGWAALWRRDSGRVVGVRIAAIDGAPLEEPVALAGGGDQPFVTESGRFVFRGERGVLLSGDVLCAP